MAKPESGSGSTKFFGFLNKLAKLLVKILKLEKLINKSTTSGLEEEMLNINK